mgnify:CR=1 FL=1
MDVIDTFLATFIAYIDSGFGLLAGDVAYLSTTLIAIDITLAGLFWALSQNTDVIAGLLKKVLYVGFFAFIIGNFAFLSAIIFDSFAELGLRAGGSTMTAGDLMRPGFIAATGYDAAKPLLEEYGGEYLAAGRSSGSLEGEAISNPMVLTKWANIGELKRFWNSPEYEKLKMLRSA